jgi:GNAT superfamily N-acetyltransferase
VSETQPIIRRAGTDDLPAVAGLRWRWSVDENGAAPQMSRAQYDAALVAWAGEHDDSHVGFVAELDGSIVGMTWVAITARFPTPQSAQRRTADLQSVYVVPEARGRGIGSALIRAALDEATARGASRAVVHSSDAAIDLYARHGFASSARLRDRDLP